MPIKAVLFDLDGTLLPMDQDVFLHAYLGGLTRRIAKRGYDPKMLLDAIWKGTGAMVKNTGEVTNEALFWQVFSAICGDGILSEYSEFEAFYEEDFPTYHTSCGYDPRARAVLDTVHEKGLLTALATNPFFPRAATEERIRWAGLSPSDFAFYTTYEDSRHCKPNLDYYRDVTSLLGVDACDCLMVGNDVDEDMIAKELGMRVFLLTDCLINRSETDISRYPNGNFDDLLSLIKAL